MTDQLHFLIENQIDELIVASANKSSGNSASKMTRAWHGTPSVNSIRGKMTAVHAAAGDCHQCFSLQRHRYAHTKHSPSDGWSVTAMVRSPMVRQVSTSRFTEEFPPPAVTRSPKYHTRAYGTRMVLCGGPTTIIEVAAGVARRPRVGRRTSKAPSRSLGPAYSVEAS